MVSSRNFMVRATIHCLFSHIFQHVLVFHFPDDASDYLDDWCQQFEQLKEFLWIPLRKFPDWLSVKKSMESVAKKTTFDLIENSSKVFDQYGYAKNFCTDAKIMEWKDKMVTTEDRWVEVFQFLEAQHLPYVEFSRIVEFALCLPGSSAPCERVFSLAKQLWKTESTNLKVETLNAMLKVKYNMEMKCVEFYEFLKNEQELLQRISSQDKYDFITKNTDASSSSAPNKSTNAMSFETVDLDDI